MKSNLREIAKELNAEARNYKIGELQNIRKKLKGLSKRPTKEIFVDNPNTMTDDWAYHYGGRSEIQFNIGIENNKFRYGLAFSLETSQTLPNIDLLKPKIKILNKLIQENPELFRNYQMWIWKKEKRSQNTAVRKISSELIQNGTFIFFGKLISFDNINSNEILTTFDNMLEIYKSVETVVEKINTKQTKTCILKPIMWNTNNYTGPSGFQSAGGFSKDFGYGHEEWNNNSNWIWRNFKIFHTESKPKLIEYSNDGNLGIIMIAAFDKKQYAVGIATNVYHSDNEERNIIARELNIYENKIQIWNQSTVQKAFNNDNDKFINHWNENYTWIQWKCPIENYFWFEKPIQLNPLEISGKDKLITMHGSYQRVLPQQVLKTLHKHLKDKPKILDWLTNGEFEVDWTDEGTLVETNIKLRKKYLKKGANAPSKSSFSYWVEGERNIEPLHAKLQAQYTEYLSQKKLKFKENVDYVDVQYILNNETYFCEVKPTQNVDTKYAIRIAIGQLLEYQYFANKNAKLEILLSSRPNEKEISFVKSLKIKLTYHDELTNEFVTI